MTGIRRIPIACENMNHRRTNSPVPYCPQCGGVVNRDLPRVVCSGDYHAVSRRGGSKFCVKCGLQLIVSRV
jgi:hypothetical protein